MGEPTERANGGNNAQRLTVAPGFHIFAYFQDFPCQLCCDTTCSLPIALQSASVTRLTVLKQELRTSATCKPLKTSPLASTRVFPCSRVMLAANLSQFCLINATSLNMICCLVNKLVAFHFGKALAAESTAAFSSASVDCGTRVTRLLVAGS